MTRSQLMFFGVALALGGAVSCSDDSGGGSGGQDDIGTQSDAEAADSGASDAGASDTGSTDPDTSDASGADGADSSADDVVDTDTSSDGGVEDTGADTESEDAGTDVADQDVADADAGDTGPDVPALSNVGFFRGMPRFSAYSDEYIVGFSASCLYIYDVERIPLDDGSVYFELETTFRDDESNENAYGWPFDDASSFGHAAFDGDGHVWITVDEGLREIDPATGEVLQFVDPRDPDGDPEDDPEFEILALPGGQLVVRGYYGAIEYRDTVILNADGTEAGRIAERFDDVLPVSDTEFVALRRHTLTLRSAADGSLVRELVEIEREGSTLTSQRIALDSAGNIIAYNVENGPSGGRPVLHVVAQDGTLLASHAPDFFFDGMHWASGVAIVDGSAVVQARSSSSGGVRLASIGLETGAVDWSTPEQETENLPNRGGTVIALSDGTAVASRVTPEDETVVTGYGEDGTVLWVQTFDNPMDQIRVDDEDVIWVGAASQRGCAETRGYVVSR